MTAERVSAYRTALRLLCELRTQDHAPHAALHYMHAVERVHAAFGCPSDIMTFAGYAKRRQWFADVWPRLNRSLFAMADERGYAV